MAYVSATSSALIVSLSLKKYLARVFLINITSLFSHLSPARCHTAASFPQVATPLVLRYVPFAAVASANIVNIPFMRQR